MALTFPSYVQEHIKNEIESLKSMLTNVYGKLYGSRNDMAYEEADESGIPSLSGALK